MKIGIIGAGNVGGTLGKRWSELGHSVGYSSRQPGAVANVAQNHDVLLLATPWPATKQILASAGNLSGKTLIDATNPLLPDLSGLSEGATTSGGELVAGWAAGAKVVKAFNTVGSNIMADPRKATLFYCGDDMKAKQTVHGLASEIGFDARDAGSLKQARLLEPFALLWISLAFGQGYGREFAFHLVRR